MTKKEAFNFLSDTKVFVENKTEEIQKKAFELGYYWPKNNKKFQFTDKPFLYFNSCGLIDWGENITWFYDNYKTLITADEILQITIDYEFKPYDQVLVRNNKSDTWTATFYSYQIPEGMLDTKQHVCCGRAYNYCIPYEGNEELAGTNKEYNK